MESVEITTLSTTNTDLAPEDQQKSQPRSSVLTKLESWLSPVLVSRHPPFPSSAGPAERLKYSCLCPPHGWLGDLLTLATLLLTVWAVSYSLLGPLALPTPEVITVNIQGGAVFTSLLLLVCSVLGGKMVELVRLPPLLGMLLVGMLLANVPHIKTVGRLEPGWSSAIRSTALVVILIRAGLGLDPVKLRSLSGMVFRLAFLPCLAESSTVALASHLILGLPVIWGFMLGFVLAAVSPAVIIPCLMSLSERGYGVAKGVPTLVISACAADDVVAISGLVLSSFFPIIVPPRFGIFLGISFNENADTLQLALHGPIEVAIGLSFGLGWGLLAQWLPSKESPNCGFFRSIACSLSCIEYYLGG